MKRRVVCFIDRKTNELLFCRTPDGDVYYDFESIPPKYEIVRSYVNPKSLKDRLKMALRR